MKRLAIIGLAVFMVMGLAGFGWAYTITLGDGNAALDAVAGDYPPPYADVIVTWISGTQATITVNAYSYDGGTNFYSIGDGSSIALNTNGNATASGFSWVGGNSKTEFTIAPDGNVSDFGVFNLIIDNFDGANSAVTSLTFTLTNLSATLWTSATDVLTKNASNYLAASHIFIKAADVTGFAGNVPEPGTLALLGAGLVGVGLLRRKFKK